VTFNAWAARKFPAADDACVRRRVRSRKADGGSGVA